MRACSTLRAARCRSFEDVRRAQVYDFALTRADVNAPLISIDCVPMGSEGDSSVFVELVGKHLLAASHANVLVAGIASDNDPRFELIDDFVLGSQSARARICELKVPYFASMEFTPINIPAFPYSLCKAPRGVTLERMPFYTSRCERHAKKCAAAQMRTPSRFFSMGEFAVSHTALVHGGLPLQSYSGKCRQSDNEADAALMPYGPPTWNGWGVLVYMFVVSNLTRAYWDNSLHVGERCYMALFVFFILFFDVEPIRMREPWAVEHASDQPKGPYTLRRAARYQVYVLAAGMGRCEPEVAYRMVYGIELCFQAQTPCDW